MFHGMSKRGISIVEVLVAMALIALCLGGILSLLVQGMGMGGGVDNAFVATSLARNRVERIREIRKDSGYAALSECSETNTPVDRNGASDPNGSFERTTVIDATYGSGLTKVTVRVKYKAGSVFAAQPVELVTVLSSYVS